MIKDYDKLTLKNNNLLVSSLKANKQEVKVSIDTLNCVIIENSYTLFSMQLINILINNNVLVIVSDDKHDPNVVMLPLSSHCMPLVNLELQLKITKDLKEKIWTKIIYNKIFNQIEIMKELITDQTVIERCEQQMITMNHNDQNNREGIVAKMFFHALYGTNFIRFADDQINSALNYGYKIISSALSRTIAKYGLNLFIGVHHIGRSNPFNLTYDLIEPYRPIVDRWVFQNKNYLQYGSDLSYLNRLSLIKLLNKHVIIDHKVMTVNSSFNVYVKSFISALKYHDSSKIKNLTIIEEASIIQDQIINE